VAPLTTTPLGSLGSVFFRVVIRTLSSLGRVVQVWLMDELMFAKKPFVILWANFITLLRPSGDGITAKRHTFLLSFLENLNLKN
jgi:hypothetical protein